MRNETRRPHPPRVDAHLVGRTEIGDDAALVTAALEYRTRSIRFVDSHQAGQHGAASTPPRDVVLQFHSAIYFHTTRAIVGRALAASGIPFRGEDAAACAAKALFSARRSRLALLRFPDGDERRALVALLERLSRRLEHLFPGAVAMSRSRSRVRFRGTKGNQDRQEREI